MLLRYVDGIRSLRLPPAAARVPAERRREPSAARTSGGACTQPSPRRSRPGRPDRRDRALAGGRALGRGDRGDRARGPDCCADLARLLAALDPALPTEVQRAAHDPNARGPARVGCRATVRAGRTAAGGGRRIPRAPGPAGEWLARFTRPDPCSRSGRSMSSLGLVEGWDGPEAEAAGVPWPGRLVHGPSRCDDRSREGSDRLASPARGGPGARPASDWPRPSPPGPRLPAGARDRVLAD